jgi:hypothetical protein
VDSLPRSIAALTAAAPALVIRLPLESPGTITFEAGSCEDEHRLRVWLRGSRRLDEVVAILPRLLDDLDEHDREEAA